MKDIRINNKLNRVFVLKETDDRIVHIPLKSLHRVDYNRLVDIEKRTGKEDMLKVMSETTLDNGRNALDQYDAHIEIYVKHRQSNLQDPTSLEENAKPAAEKAEEQAKAEAPKSRRRGPGRPKKTETQ